MSDAVFGPTVCCLTLLCEKLLLKLFFVYLKSGKGIVWSFFFCILS